MSEPVPLSKPAPPQSPPAASMARHWYVRVALQVLAVVSLAMGIIGVFVPGLPTTVFILIAGWAAMRSSERMHAWLWQHRLFGPMLQNWAAGGCVSRRAKLSAACMMGLCAAILSLAPTPMWVRVVACSCMAGVLIWLWMRPEPDTSK